MSGRQRESHHLLHLTGASTNTSHQFFSGQDLSSEHDIHTASPNRTEQRRGPRGSASPWPRRKTARACRQLLLQPSATESSPRRARAPQTAASPQSHTREFPSRSNIPPHHQAPIPPPLAPVPLSHSETNVYVTGWTARPTSCRQL